MPNAAASRKQNFFLRKNIKMLTETGNQTFKEDLYLHLLIL